VAIVMEDIAGADLVGEVAADETEEDKTTFPSD
jgi:hypothetical protein